MSLNETISNLGDSIINLVDKKRHGTLGLEQGDVGYDKEVWADIYKYKHSTFDRSKFTVVGSPNITEDGIASGFSNSNYLNSPNLTTSGDKYEISFEFNSKNTVATATQIMYVLRDNTNSNEGLLMVYKNAQNKIAIAQPSVYGAQYFFNAIVQNNNTRARIDITYVKSQGHIQVNYYENGMLIKRGGSSTTADWSNISFVRFGYSAFSGFKGSIDLKQFSITVDGKEVFSGNKTGIDIIKPDNYEVTGSPVISDEGNLLVDKWFSNTVVIPNSIFKQLEGNSWKICFGGHFIKNNNYSHHVLMYEKNTDGQHEPNGHIKVNYNLAVWVNGGGSVTFGIRELVGTEQKIDSMVLSGIGASAEFDYIGYVEYDGVNQYTLAFSKDNGVTWHKKTITSDIKIKTFQDRLYLGGTSDTEAAIGKVGTINLNEFKIYVNNKLLYQPMLKVPYTETKAGYKVAPYEWRTCLKQLKEEKGCAPYYTIQENRKENFSKVGNPTIVDGVASGFINSGTYINSDLSLSPTSKLVVKSRAVFDNSNTNSQVIFRLYNPAICRITVERNGFNLWCNNNTFLTKTLNNGDIIDIEAIYETNKQTYYITVNGVTTQVNGAITCSLANLNLTGVIFGRYAINDANNYFVGSIDLNAFKIYVDNKLAYQAITPPNYTLPQGDVYGVLSAKANSSEISRYSMPSDKYIDLTLGASGSTYTAPANGYFTISKLTNGDTNQNVTLMNTGKDGSFTKWGTHIINRCVNTVNGVSACTFIPASKGDIVKVIYTAGGTLEGFRFIYAEGEV